MTTFYTSLALALAWTLGALLTIKLDAVLCPSPSQFLSKFLLSMIIWPVLAVLLLTTKHRSSNVTGNFDY